MVLHSTNEDQTTAAKNKKDDLEQRFEDFNEEHEGGARACSNRREAEARGGGGHS